MSDFYQFVKEYMKVCECEKTCKYCKIGHNFCIDTDEAKGVYWFYETEDFIVSIHDFFIKKEMIQTNFPNMDEFMLFSSSYIITANGESFNPYQTLTSNVLYIIDLNNVSKNYRFLLHAGSPYLSVEINFKKQMIEKYLDSLKDKVSYSDIFFNTKLMITKALEHLAKDILNCKMESPAAEIFFEAKAKEWLSLTIDAFLTRKNSFLSEDDNKAIKNVAKYLDDHYAINVPQETLEKISMMSGTKLKKLFKQKYQMSITEYSQRRRMNIAEILLLNSNLKIKEIAESVGYSSHSKFSTYYKKYKGVYPKDIKKQVSEKLFIDNCDCFKDK
ncbi:helix-turn-helix domain-containing protein [Peptostreptococcus sp. D1]|uniref:helix-turn-helix domain-containing protein n=1 Tax=Peptostreptococcus sp. D1 TaxID=72304 RepID=UPI0008E2AA2E|nr:AraC family transcriptional regulator [Peptostreptococcus sp. D1]SFE71813.1 AraC-type DNA-binding protein [Peptostreptococcus sp. D1]